MLKKISLMLVSFLSVSLFAAVGSEQQYQVSVKYTDSSVIFDLTDTVESSELCGLNISYELSAFQASHTLIPTSGLVKLNVKRNYGMCMMAFGYEKGRLTIAKEDFLSNIYQYMIMINGKSAGLIDINHITDLNPPSVFTPYSNMTIRCMGENNGMEYVQTILYNSKAAMSESFTYDLPIADGHEVSKNYNGTFSKTSKESVFTAIKNGQIVYSIHFPKNNLLKAYRKVENKKEKLVDCEILSYECNCLDSLR